MDILQATTGRLVAELIDSQLETICPVNEPHPIDDAIATGSSRSLFLWRARAAGERGGGGEEADGDDGDGNGEKTPGW